MWCLWSAKGGVGCSVVAASAAVLASRHSRVLLVDLGGGDLPVLLGTEPAKAGLVDWLESTDPPPDALARLEVAVSEMLDLLPWGRPASGPGIASATPLDDRMILLGRMLADDPRPVIVDLGNLGPLGPMVNGFATRRHVLRSTKRSTLVSRLCYSAVTAAMRHPQPDDVVLVVEPGRALRPADVRAALGVVTVTTVRWDPSVARAADAGLLAQRLPRALHRLRLPSAEAIHSTAPATQDPVVTL